LHTLTRLYEQRPETIYSHTALPAMVPCMQTSRQHPSSHCCKSAQPVQLVWTSHCGSQAGASSTQLATHSTGSWVMAVTTATTPRTVGGGSALFSGCLKHTPATALSMLFHCIMASDMLLAVCCSLHRHCIRAPTSAQAGRSTGRQGGAPVPAWLPLTPATAAHALMHASPHLQLLTVCLSRPMPHNSPFLPACADHHPYRMWPQPLHRCRRRRQLLHLGQWELRAPGPQGAEGRARA
jgi:hypothetical protein